MASASAVLLCLIVTLLYIFIQFFIDPAELRTHPYYKSTQWLLSGPSQVLAHPSSRLWGKNLPSGGGASAWPAPQLGEQHGRAGGRQPPRHQEAGSGTAGAGCSEAVLPESAKHWGGGPSAPSPCRWSGWGAG